MNATPPEARAEYSRGLKPPEAVSAITPPVALAIFAGTLMGALLLFVAEFTTLYEVRTDASTGPIKSIETGSHHTYALIPIALLALVLGYGAWRERSRSAMLAIGALGVIALLIALIGDLPDAEASGLIGTAARYVGASSRPTTGLYMETLGAAALILTAGLGLLLGGPPRQREPRDRTPIARPTSAR